MTTDDFDWQPLGQQFWLDSAKQLGASDRQMRFAVAKFRNCSNTEAARQAGYAQDDPGAIRSTAYRLARSNITAKLLAFATAESGGAGYDGNVDRVEARSILSRLARQSDPNIKIRACEQLAKFDEADRQQRNQEVEPDPKQIAAEILRACPHMGAAVLLDCHMGEDGKPFGMPYLKELAPILRKDFPALWQKMLSRINDQVQLLELEAMAGGPVLSIEQIVGPAPEKKTEAAQ